MTSADGTRSAKEQVGARAPEARVARDRTHEPRTAHADVLALQRTAGNRAVGELIEPPIGRTAMSSVDAAATGTTEPNKGRPLDDSTRADMEARFGTHLADVRIHTDQDAARRSDSLSANAFTIGSDVYFGRGTYRPSAPEGKGVLAHEIAHVLQQRIGADSGGGAAEPRHEMEAEFWAGAASAPRSASADIAPPLSSVSPGVVQASPRRPANPLRREEIGDAPSPEDLAADPERMWVYLAQRSSEYALQLKSAAAGPGGSEEDFAKLVRLSALGLMAAHRAHIERSREETVDQLRKGPGQAGSPAGAAMTALRRAAAEVARLEDKKADLWAKHHELEHLRSEIGPRGVDAGRIAEAVARMWYATVDEMTDAQAGEFLREYDATENLQSFGWRQGEKLLRWREKQIETLVVAIAEIYDAFPALSRLVPAGLGRGELREDADLITAIREAFSDVLHDVDRAIRMIADGEVHPFDLPEAVRAVRDSLTASGKKQLERVIFGRTVRRFWIARGIDLVTAAIMFTPVVGPVVLAGVALVGTGAHIEDMVRRSLLADASTNPYESPIGVDEPSKLEIVLAGIEIALTAVALWQAGSAVRESFRLPEPAPGAPAGERPAPAGTTSASAGEAGGREPIPQPGQRARVRPRLEPKTSSQRKPAWATRSKPPGREAVAQRMRATASGETAAPEPNVPGGEAMSQERSNVIPLRKPSGVVASGSTRSPGAPPSRSASSGAPNRRLPDPRRFDPEPPRTVPREPAIREGGGFDRGLHVRAQPARGPKPVSPSGSQAKAEAQAQEILRGPRDVAEAVEDLAPPVRGETRTTKLEAKPPKDPSKQAPVVLAERDIIQATGFAQEPIVVTRWAETLPESYTVYRTAKPAGSEQFIPASYKQRFGTFPDELQSLFKGEGFEAVAVENARGGKLIAFDSTSKPGGHLANTRAKAQHIANNAKRLPKAWRDHDVYYQEGYTDSESGEPILGDLQGPLTGER